MVRSRDHVEILSSADGEPVALHDFGGTGPAVLLGHGNGLNAGMWLAAVAHLRHRFHCYGIDLRGHGACRPINPDYSVSRERFADDVLACVAAVGEPVLYAGHSLGGAAGVYAALSRPEAFTGIWLFEPVVIPEGFLPPGVDQPSELLEAARRRRMDFDSVDDAYQRLASKPPFDACDPAAVRAYVEIGTYPVDGGGIRLSCRGEDEARVFASNGQLDFTRLAAIQVPAVVAAGADVQAAHAVPARLAAVIADALGNARLEHHPGVGHFGPMQAPGPLAESMLRHFAILTGS